VKLRNMGEDVSDREAAWNALPPCAAPEDPNFHQAARTPCIDYIC